ncbi:MAG: DUF4250 domain-containing protein [Muribaculaceae bacterium]|nr:DUF4250 domain-containing protein [Muribaculaceae bacterium]
MNNVTDNKAITLDDRFPKDPAMLLSFINMKLRDDYPDGLASLCEDMGVSQEAITSVLASAGFEYSRENNRFW